MRIYEITTAVIHYFKCPYLNFIVPEKSARNLTGKRNKDSKLGGSHGEVRADLLVAAFVGVKDLAHGGIRRGSHLRPGGPVQAVLDPVSRDVPLVLLYPES